jgi:hypothetical protein
MRKMIWPPLMAALGVASAAPAQQGNVAAPPLVRVPGPPVSPEPATNIHEFRPAFVPLVALPLDLGQRSDPIWVKDDKPAADTIARLTLTPLEGVTVEQNVGQGAGKPLLLLRALTGEPARYKTAADLRGEGARRLYCAGGGEAGLPGRIVCLEDRDGDGRFESRATGVGEYGEKAEQLSILGKAAPLPAPVAYRTAAAETLPRHQAVYRNCAKDHDRPRYSLAVTNDDNRVTAAELQDAARAQGGRVDPWRIGALLGRDAPCTRGDEVDRGEAHRPATLADGAVVARLGELVIEVGPKEKGAAVRLLGLRHADRLYRLNRASVLAASEAVTDKQRALALGQKFGRPAIMTAGAIEVAEGPRAVGDVVLTSGFSHGFMGVLTQDTVIRTLFSKRSLPKGTVLYGIPMSSRMTSTRYGLPTASFPNSGMPDPDNVHLTWCVPVQDEAQWTATCLPSQGGDRYTLLKGQRPAFEVTGFSYAADTSTNDGPVPVAVQPGDFGKPLAYRFKIKSIADNVIVLTQETNFGEEVINSRDHHLVRVKGQVSGLIFSGGLVTFSDVEGAPDRVEVRRELPFKLGDPPAINSGIIDLEAVRRVAARRAPAESPAD